MAQNEMVRPEDLEGLPPWLAAMRKAAMDAISTSDVSEIVKDQVKRAKAGDEKAMKFVFEQVLGGNQLKGATFVQNNYYDSEADPKKKTQARPGTAKKISVMQRRVAGRLPVNNSEDNDEVNLD